MINIKKIIRNNLLVDGYLRRRYEKRFRCASHSNLFKGIFNTYQTAQACLPETKPAGYDNEQSANMYDDRMRTIYATDYPVLFWMKQILKPDSKVFEIGGHVGVSFYSYDHFMGLGEAINWTILDVEAVVSQGKIIAQERQEHRLHFTAELTANPDTEVVFASGSLQYIEKSLAEMIKDANISPQHVLVNLFPCNFKPDYFTVNNIGTAFCPYKITSKKVFIEQMEKIGFILIDEWANDAKRCVIPFYDPSYSLSNYTGFYFKRITASLEQR